MKKTMEKTLAILLLAIFVASSMSILPAYSVDGEEPRLFSVMQGDNTWIVEAIQGTTDAVTFYDYYYADPYTVTTTADLTVVPNPIGVDQQLQGMAWINPLPPGEEAFHALTIDITNPDGIHETISFDTNGFYYFQYTPTSVGTYKFQLNYPGDEYEDGTLVYLPSQSSQYSINVQEEPVPIPSPPPPPDQWLASAPEGSGHTPYMEDRKSKMYLYEDMTTGELSLIIHHNKDELPSVEFGMNMSVNDLPSGAYLALGDDDSEVWWEDPDWVLAGWPDVYRSDSEGMVISGLSTDEAWTISVYAGAVGAIDAWEYQTATGAIPLDMLRYPEPGPIVPVIISTELPGYTLDITVNPPEGGNVTKDPDLETYPLGTEVELEAFANEGYTFAGWSGDLTGTTNPQTLVIDEDPQVTASFSLDFIPPSEKPITVYPHPDVVLTFDQVLTGGEVHVTASDVPPPGYPLEGIGPYYYIEANPLTFTNVSIGIHYDDTGLTSEQEAALTLWRFDPAGSVTGDVNGNGRVDLIDLLIITFALGTSPGQRRWNPSCDLNGDLKVNVVDLLMAIMNFGKTSTPAVWTNITTHIDVVNNIVYGDTDHFSPYRVH